MLGSLGYRRSRHHSHALNFSYETRDRFSRSEKSSLSHAYFMMLGPYNRHACQPLRRTTGAPRLPKKAFCFPFSSGLADTCAYAAVGISKPVMQMRLSMLLVKTTPPWSCLIASQQLDNQCLVVTLSYLHLSLTLWLLVCKIVVNRYNSTRRLSLLEISLLRKSRCSEMVFRESIAT